MIKKCVAECLGTFVIVFAPVACAAATSTIESGSSLLISALVSGFSVLAMIYSLGPISGAHFNPAVTIGFSVARKFPIRSVVGYIFAQLGGSTLAALASFQIFGKSSGAHIPADPSAPLRNLLLEVILSFFLMFVIMGVATNKQVSKSVPGVAIGFIVVCGVLIGGSVTGGSMNPARSFGPALFNPQAMSNYWIYVLAPIVGASLAALTYEGLREKNVAIEK